MTLKELFLDEAKVGCQIAVSVSGRREPIVGIINALDGNICRIQTVSGSPRVALDGITSYDILEEDPAGKPVIDTTPISNRQLADNKATILFSQPEPINVLNDILESVPPDDFEIVDWDGIRESLTEDAISTELRQKVESIRSAFKYIHSHLDQMPPNELDKRLHDLRAKILVLCKKYPDACLDLYCMIAAMYFITRQYKDSLEYFIDGQDVYSAVYAAHRAGNSNELTKQINQYIVTPPVNDPFLYRLYADDCLKTRDITAMCSRVRKLCKTNLLSEDDHKELLCLCAVGLRVTQVLGLSAGWAISFAEGNELTCIELFLNSLPGSWVKIAMDHKSENKNSAQSLTAPLKATIHSFDNERRYGWINGIPSNHFFYITQVNCEDALREVLAYPGMSRGLEVTFRLGIPTTPGYTSAAFDIRLTERGEKEAKNRLARTKPSPNASQEIKGDIQEYNYNFGKIYANGEPYNVIEAQIIDPYLKGYLAIHLRPDIAVKFVPGKDNHGKNIAKKVRIDDNVIPLPSSDVDEMLKSKAVTQAELDRWNNRSNSDDELKQPIIEDYYSLPYVALEPLKQSSDDKSAAPAPIKDNDAKEINQPKLVTTGPELPPLEPLPLPEENRFANLPVIPLDDEFYDKAHKCLIAGNLEKAEELYIQALCARDRTESAVSDMASQVFLRGDDSRIADAYQVVDAFKSFIPREKEILLKISVCQKTKNRPYQIKLCYLINELIEITGKANTKLHFLSIQGNTLRNLGEYQMALASFTKWHRAYENEVQYRGQPAVFQYANSLNYVKTAEAACYYFIGDRAYAKKLAKEVLRISSDNATAQSILDDTLDLLGANDLLVPISEDEYRLDNIQISAFAKAQMDTAPISKYVKKDVENGRYIGSAQAASAVIRSLLEVRGKTPAMRCEIMRVAAHIISQQRTQTVPEDYHKLQELHLTESDQKKYIARSMAAFGDVLLESSDNTADSARYGFLQAIELLDSKEDDFNRSMKHYIESFYNAQQEMAQIVRKDLEAGSVKYNFLMLGKQAPLDFDEFAIGMFELCIALKKAHFSTRSELVRVLNDSKASSGWRKWIDQLSGDCGQSGFMQKLDYAVAKYNEYRALLSDRLERLPSQFFSRHSSKELADEIADAARLTPLPMTDKDRIRKLCTIIHNFSGYFTTVQFQYLSNLLQTTETDILKLIQKISDQPTQFSYDVLLSNLQKMHTDLQQATEEHYRALPPDIVITSTDIGAYVGMNNEINLHLTISNGGTASDGTKRQMADNISIAITKISDGVEYLRMESDFTGGIFGGEDAEVILVFRITDSKILMYGIDLSLRCSYRYNENRTAAKDAYVDYNDTIVIRQGVHAKIKNPYAPYVGNEMNNPDMFKGRDQIIECVTDALVTEQGYNYGKGYLFYGQTRAGKSSIRVNLKKRIREKFPNIILADLGNLDPNSFYERSFYGDLLFKVRDEIWENHPELYQELLERSIQAPPDSFVEDDIEIVKTKFRRYFEKLFKVIRNKTMIVVMADEFSAINTAIQNGRASANFMQSWKAWLEDYGFFAICFGQDDSPDFIKQNENAFGKMTIQMVTYLEKPYAIKLMEEPLMVTTSDGIEKPRLTPAVTEELYRLTAGSAFLIVKLCSMLVEFLNEKGADFVTPGVLRGFLKSRAFTGQECIRENDFEPQINDRADLTLSEANETVLLRIARAAQDSEWVDLASISDADLNPRDNWTPPRWKEWLLTRLQKRDVIEIEEGRRCRSKVGLLNLWLLMKYGSEE